MTLGEHIKNFPEGIICITGTDRKVLKAVADRLEKTRHVYYLPERDLDLHQQWGFVQRLKILTPKNDSIVITQCAWIISDSKNVLVMGRNIREVSVPEFNTFGASVNKITMGIFERRETMGDYSISVLKALQDRLEAGESPSALIEESYQVLGDSVERTLFINMALDKKKG